MSVPQQGSETRTSILPAMAPSGIGFFGSPYQPADQMVTPSQLGIHVGDSMDDVARAMKGVGFYVDQIGFGAASTSITAGMPLQPLGVNYFMETGATCSNGAKMWRYIQGIPDGSALGSRVQEELQRTGLPALRGLAPGMLEDVKNGLNPAPLMNAMFGSGYPKCERVTLQVGDNYGRIRDPSTGASWISDEADAVQEGGVWKQTRWVQMRDAKGQPINMDRDEWVAEEKTMNPDGTPVEGFVGRVGDALQHPASVIVVGALCLAAFAVLRRS
jgi:hypothetical protein